MFKKIKIRNSEKLHKRAKKIIPYGAQTYSKGVKAFSDGVSPKFLAKGLGCDFGSASYFRIRLCPY